MKKLLLNGTFFFTFQVSVTHIYADTTILQITNKEKKHHQLLGFHVFSSMSSPVFICFHKVSVLPLVFWITAV